MKEQKLLSITFTASILSAFVFMVLILFTIFFNKNFLFTQFVHQIIFVIFCICLFVSIVSFKKSIIEIKYEIQTKKERERNVRDVFLYNQLLDPPTTNN